jgi:hypothetical protein
MSFTYAATTADVVEPTVQLSDDGENLSIWPTGRTGPLIVTTTQEWRVLSAAVEVALSVNRSNEARLLSLDTYAAQEGRNGHED